MNQLLASVALNVAVASTLAGIVWLVGRYVRRPALLHALWLLVLLKLVTPPLFGVSVPVPQALSAWVGSNPPKLAVASRPLGTGSTATAAPAGAWTAAESTTSPSHSATAAHQTVAPATPASVAPPVELHRGFARWWWVGPASLWMAGVLAWWGINVHVFVRFRKTLNRWGRPCPALSRQAALVASPLGLSRAPEVWTLDAAVAPMLWGCGRWARIVLPARLIERLDGPARDALLIHELAHYRRGDHWVRLFELAVTGLYWWNPVVWWARRQISECEEVCCDAWVVSQLAASRRSYAEALLETLDFISDERATPVPFASAVGDLPAIEQRLREIMRGATPRSLSPLARWAVLAAAAMLPLEPVFLASPAQARQQGARPDPADLAGLVRPKATAAVEAAPVVPESVATLILPPPTRHPALETGPPNHDWATAQAPGGRFDLAAGPADRVRIRDRRTGAEVELPSGAATAAAFTPNDRLLAGAGNGDVRWYDAVSGTPVSFLGKHRAEVTSLAVTADGRLAVSGGRDGHVFVWDLASGGAIKRQWNMHRPVSAVQFSPDGRQVVVSAGDWREGASQVALYDLATGTMRSEWELDAAVGAVRFADEGRMLVTAAWDGEVTFWDLDGGRPVGRGRVEKDAVSSAGFSADSDLLAGVRMTEEAGL
jgi:beta-lactamase regulating signal transducer with metallopeptidase domain